MSHDQQTTEPDDDRLMGEPDALVAAEETIPMDPPGADGITVEGHLQLVQTLRGGGRPVDTAGTIARATTGSSLTSTTTRSQLSSP